MSSTPPFLPPLWSQRWQRFSAAVVRGFHAYGAWLTTISWVRFAILSGLLLLVVNLLQSLPPFRWTFTETISVPAEDGNGQSLKKLKTPKLPELPHMPEITVERSTAPADGAPPARDRSDRGGHGVDITINGSGVHIVKAAPPAPAAPAAPTAPAASGAAPAPSASAVEDVIDVRAGDKQIKIVVPPGADAEAMRDAIEEAKQAVVDAAEQARDAAEEARNAAEEAMQQAASQDAHTRIHTVQIGDFLMDLALLWIVASAIIKITYKGRIQAEVKAAQATETAEAESLKRQVVEARMAAMQAQVEPHFLFNTLASIDHLIETDPPRASQMQKNLIALLRASMPTMRDTSEAGPRDLGRELALVRPYVEILKVRMEERLDAQIDVPDGLLSAEFPSMMIQTLVENAIRHGLEPKAEGGQLRVKAEIVHGQLQVTVADTGVGFGAAATSGTGVGLANIRERLQLLHGADASLTITANQPSGTIITITVPYRTVGGRRPAA